MTTTTTTCASVPHWEASGYLRNVSGVVVGEHGHQQRRRARRKRRAVVRGVDRHDAVGGLRDRWVQQGRRRHQRGAGNAWAGPVQAVVVGRAPVVPRQARQHACVRLGRGVGGQRLWRGLTGPPGQARHGLKRRVSVSRAARIAGQIQAAGIVVAQAQGIAAGLWKAQHGVHVYITWPIARLTHASELAFRLVSHSC